MYPKTTAANMAHKHNTSSIADGVLSLVTHYTMIRKYEKVLRS